MPNAYLIELHRLLQTNVKCSRGAEEEASFRVVKDMLLQDEALVNCDPDLALVPATHSSSYSPGDIWSHCTPGGEELPIAYASRSLTETEKYSQIEKEALSQAWGVKEFQTYLECHHSITDQQPFKYIMDPGKAVPVTTAARIKRLCLVLGDFSYSIEFRGTMKQHSNCDDHDYPTTGSDQQT